MTDLLETLFDVEEVKINPIIAALRTPFNAAVVANVQRFGFEYEMFPKYHDVEINVDTEDVWSDDHDPCNCESCIDQRIRDRIEELREEGIGTGNELAQRAYNLHLVKDPDPHPYHCQDDGCDDCDYSRSGPLMAAQRDCSCGIEFVSRIIDLRDFDTAESDITKWVRMMREWRDDGNWMPDGYTVNGNHVHVSHQGEGQICAFGQYRESAWQHINALYAAFDWTDVADGGCGQMRQYPGSAKPSRHNGDGSWCSFRDETFEHRLWNTPCIPARLWSHIGLSIAITRWAFAVAIAHPTFSFWELSDYRRRMTDYHFEMMHRHLSDIISGIRQYIPDNACFDEARQLILNLS